ncbi:uncharacterized protein LOC127595089 [Hippocampus zosterae]|uniref:uncharacterized protein LOC127595089 n=1 Tax=Hippocampus zosterae TaxID=109293 RepID=UPI00223CAD54|nr:uncharacterized protein LOC127595089 [Hippocampus zosterae]
MLFFTVFELVAALPYSYSEDLARTVAQLGALAHCSPEVISAWSCPLCKKLPLTNPQPFGLPDFNLSGYTGTMGTRLFLLFRGTEPESVINWIEDLTFEMVAYPHCEGCRVHAGFFASFKALRGQYFDRVQQAVSAGKEVVVGGRSMGAALAVFAVLDLARTFPEHVRVSYNMGCPRLGNQQFADWASKQLQIYRLVHWNDIVPHLPPRTLNYRHISREVFYDEPMANFSLCNDSG